MWLHLQRCILEDLADVQSLAERTANGGIDQWNVASGICEPLASIRGAYHARNKQAGLCKSCPRAICPASTVYCQVHLDGARERSRRSRQAAFGGSSSGSRNGS